MALHWDIGVETFTQSLRERITNHAFRLATEVYSGVISRTPVRTGNLRNSWRFSEGSPDYSVSTGGNINSPLGRPIIPVAPSKNRYPRYYITNSLDYAPYVEYGTSQMAPRAMLRRTLASLNL